VEILHRTPRSLRPMRAASTVLSVLVTALAAAYIVPSLLGLERYVITGSSMSGTVDYGSVALEEVVPVEALEVGDIITYAPPPEAGVDGMVTHRIVSIHGDVLRTKGDAVPQADPWTFRLDSYEQSRVVLSVRWVGYPAIWLADRTTRMLVIGGPAAVITLVSLVQVLNVLRRRPPRRAGPGARPTSLTVGG
jgi:signal peptidase